MAPPSAFIGQPPLTDDDYWIVRGLQLTSGMTDPHPEKGIPLKRPPPGVYHFETKGPRIVAGCAVAIALMFLFTTIRLTVRCSEKRAYFGKDDGFIIPGCLLAASWPVLQIASVYQAGAGKHLYDVTYHEFAMFNWFSTVQKMTFYVAAAFIKMSITMFNLRLTGFTSSKWLICHYAFFSAMVIFALVSIFLVTFQCNPPSAGFDSVATGKLKRPPACISDEPLTTALSVVHVVSDFCLLSVPFIVLWNAQMKFTTKLRLYVVVLLGIVSCLSSILRIVEQYHIGKDVLWAFTPLVTWTLLDLTTAIVVASLPIISVLIPRAKALYVKSRSKGSRQSSSNNTSGLRKALGPFRGESASRVDDSIPLSNASVKIEEDRSHLQPTIRHKVEQYDHDLEALDDIGRYENSQDGIRPTHDTRRGISYGQAL